MIPPELAWFAGLFMALAALMLFLAEDESTAETADRQEELLSE